MQAVVVDANVLIAARLARDEDHDSAADIVGGIDRGALPVGYVPSDVLQEVLNYLQARAGHATAVETLDALVESSGFEIVRTTKEEFDAGRSVFRTYEGLAFTDAIVVALMERRGIDYLYSFDDDFDPVPGVTRFETPTDPFGPD